MSGTKLQQRARHENWCIYVLKGQRTVIRSCVRWVVPEDTFNHLINAIDDTIALIKFQQQERNPDL